MDILRQSSFCGPLVMRSPSLPRMRTKDLAIVHRFQRTITHSFLQVFMNIVLDEAFEEKAGGEKVAIGMIVRCLVPYCCSKLN